MEKTIMNYADKVTLSLFSIIFALMFFCQVLMAADEKYPVVYELDADVMYVVPDENLLVAAEREIYLRWHIERGTKIVDTRIINDAGEDVDFSVIKSRDRVQIVGSKKDGRITADEIRLFQQAK
jgi:hypothetical protein